MVDDEDFDRVNQHRWYAARDSDPTIRFYAIRNIRTNRGRLTQRMHHFILGSTNRIDHEDGDGLNNQKQNLRNATSVENGRNMKLQIHSSPYKGVSFVPRQNQWQASGCLNKKKVHIGTYSSPVLAALAYDTFAQAFYGQFAKTNQQLGAL